VKKCCALRLFLRWAKGDPATVGFTCSACGQTYVWRDWAWQPIDTAQDIRDMMTEEHARQQRDSTTEE